MRLILVFTKGSEVRFVSHLDMLRLFQRAFRRAELPLAFSQGFNPHPLMSFATALSVGFTSRGEFLDVILTQELDPESVRERVNAALPAGVEAIAAIDAGVSRVSLTSVMRSAEYAIDLSFDEPVSPERIEAETASMLAGDITVMKKTKGGVKPTDIRPMILELRVEKAEAGKALLYMRGVLSAEGGVNPELFLGELYKRLGVSGSADICRLSIEMELDKLLEAEK